MVEFVLRCVLALVLLGVSGLYGNPSFDIGWRAAAFFASYSALAFAIERKGLRNAGVAGLLAVSDSAVATYLLAATGHLETFGFMALLPPAWAALRFGSDALAMSPIIAGWLLVGANLFEGKGWTPVLLGQAAGVLAIGVLGARKEKIVKVTELVEVQAEGEPAQSVPSEYFELREKFRQMRDHAAELERKSKRDKWAVQLAESFDAESESDLVALARKIHELCHVEGLTLYSFSQTSDRLVVQGVAGDVPSSARDTAFEIPEFLGEWQLKERLTSAVNAVKSYDEASNSGTVLLKDRGRIVGMVAMFESSKLRLAEAMESVKDSAEAIAKLVKTHLNRESEKRRLRQAELLYTVSAAGQGADTSFSLSARIARELWETCKLDHLAIVLLDQGEPSIAASHGVMFNILDSMQFNNKPGTDGWIEAESPEVVMLDVREDERFPREEALKRRIGSSVIIPLSYSEKPCGYLSVGTNRVLGIDQSVLETLRIVAAELSQALGRIENGHRATEGLANPLEFHESVQEAGQGFLVYLEVLRRDELAEIYGKPALEHAARKLAARLRPMLPTGALMCRRIEGDFVAFLRTEDQAFAGSWASNAAATASMVALTTPDGQTRIPLAVRAKVAQFSQQSNQISQVGAA